MSKDMGRTLTLENAQELRGTMRRAGKTLVFTNGHFDLLHVGHLDYLEKARAWVTRSLLDSTATRRRHV